jgi:hypothetical protein
MRGMAAPTTSRRTPFEHLSVRPKRVYRIGDFLSYGRVVSFEVGRRSERRYNARRSLMIRPTKP